ncbi:MAG: YihY/virulence factor BrkB family protein [Ornithinibacter sp.]
MTDAKRRLRRALARVPWLLTFARLAVVTIRTCLKYRVTGLASEAGFFALLSLPPLVLGLFGGLGYFGGMLGPQAVSDVREAVTRYATRFLTEDVINSTLLPTIDDVFTGRRFDLVSVGFVLSLWSGSRAVNVFVDTISIMYGQSGVRGIVRTRALSFSLYVLGIFVGIVTVPLILFGPTLLGQFLPDSWGWLIVFYWPLVTLLTVGGLTNLYHVSTPRRSPWLRDVPGAALTLVVWVIASFVVRGSIAASLGGTSIYGPLSAPIVLLIWLYALAIAVLIGAALNAALREIWPVPDERALHERLIDRTRGSWRRGSLRAPRPPRAPRWDDPFEGYGPAPDDLSLRSLQEAARGPLTPIPDARGVQGSSSGEATSSRPRADR